MGRKMLGPQMKHRPLLITVGLLLVLFLVMNEKQRGFVEKVKGAFFSPASLVQITELFILVATVALGVVSGDNSAPAGVWIGLFSSWQHSRPEETWKPTLFWRGGFPDRVSCVTLAILELTL